ncbi:benzoate 4-monooxygenase cytochrome P450 [Rhizodiscina lignyota]|uniref:Benzoate 4-monooxygenase cytochrome P450 n=1 Tax=Rhizodiscina lignyota TaxID=1504668 RepID=A0A9P4I4A8_9PEZI|nr:benzoate 4-monooxygenase cytochrome P450 [Rhizodiscina lignyota]
MALSTLSSAGLAVLRSYVLLVIYRLTFHPLARYPGNFTDKISSWPLIYQCYRGNRHLRILEAHKKYGSVIRIAPDTLDFDTTTAMAAIHRDRNANVRKGAWYKTVDAETGTFSVQTVIDRKEHNFRRRILEPAFSHSALRIQEHFIDNNVRVFLHEMGKDVQEDGWTTPKDFSQWITYFGFDFISDLAFGSCFRLLQSPEHRYLPDLLKWTSHFVYYAGYLPFAPLVRAVMGTSIMNHVPSQAARDTHKYYLEAESKLGERSAAEEEAWSSGKEGRRDIFHYLFRTRDPETNIGLSHEQLQADSGLLIAAGSDGVAVTVSAALFYLLHNSSSMAKLVHEIRSSFATLDDVRNPQMNRLPYLQAVIDESLRLAPSVLSAFPREVLRGGLNVDGLHVPVGMTVGVSGYAIHHNETYFPDSFAFRPERWLGDGESVSLARSALITFGAGTYNCIGKNVAIAAAKLVLAKTIYAYDVKAARGKVTGGGGPAAGRGREREDEYQLLDYLVAYRSGPMVQFRTRNEK